MEGQPSGLSRRPEGGKTRYKGYWDTMGLEVLWSRASKTDFYV